MSKLAGFNLSTKSQLQGKYMAKLNPTGRLCSLFGSVREYKSELSIALFDTGKHRPLPLLHV